VEHPVRLLVVVKIYNHLVVGKQGQGQGARSPAR
jgi:hypothetical protein